MHATFALAIHAFSFMTTWQRDRSAMAVRGSGRPQDLTHLDLLTPVLSACLILQRAGTAEPTCSEGGNGQCAAPGRLPQTLPRAGETGGDHRG
jgi:hypothetical protein